MRTLGLAGVIVALTAGFAFADEPGYTPKAGKRSVKVVKRVEVVRQWPLPKCREASFAYLLRCAPRVPHDPSYNLIVWRKTLAPERYMTYQQNYAWQY